MEQKQIAKGPTKTRVADKYQAMITYYAELIGLCHETVSKTESLKYCLSCVNTNLKINIEDNGQSLCKNCELLIDIPNHYKELYGYTSKTEHKSNGAVGIFPILNP